MKRTFWLLDLNQETYSGKSSIWLWGITHEGKRIVVIDDNYQPYFYLLPKDDQDPEKLRERLARESPHPSIERATIEKKKLLADEVTVLKVYCKDPASLGRAAKEAVKKLGAAGTFEEKLRHVTRYQNDYGIKPCAWYEVDTHDSSMSPADYNVGEILLATNHPEPTTIEQPPKLRVLAFSVLAVSKTGSPSPIRDPVRMIAWTTEEGRREVVQSRSESDKGILETFGETVIKADPDIVFTFGGNSLQWPYLTKRTERTKSQLKVGRDEGVPHQSLYGHYSVTGRANIDLLDFAEDIYDVKIKNVENVATYLGIETSVRQVDETEFFDYWSTTDRRKVLVSQVEEQTDTLLKVGMEALDYVIQLSALTGLPPDQVIAAATGFRVDNYLMMETHALGQLIPSKEEQPIIPYRGSIVLQPQVGLHNNVASLDFSSMYPSLMIKYNISPDTLVASDNTGDSVEVPEVHHRFRKKPDGFYRIALTKLIQARKTTKDELKRTARTDPRYPLLKAREKAVKVTTNAVYGYAGWSGARWYSREVAESAAALGRDTINRSISLAKDLGLKVLYGDTDSLFVNYEEKLVQEFLKSINDKLGLEINLSEIYKRILFTEAKKKYAGLRQDGQLDIVGLEAVRGDWSTLARDVQNKVLEFVLQDANPSRATAYVKELTNDLKSANLPLSSYVIWKTLTKPVDEYEVNAPHVEAAKKMSADGWPVTTGDKVGFVITKGPGKLFQKAEPHYKVTLEQVDYDYYVQNQIVPAAVRILSVLGVTETQLLAGSNAQVSLSGGSKRR